MTFRTGSEKSTRRTGFKSTPRAISEGVEEETKGPVAASSMSAVMGSWEAGETTLIPVLPVTRLLAVMVDSLKAAATVKRPSSPVTSMKAELEDSTTASRAGKPPSLTTP